MKTAPVLYVLIGLVLIWTGINGTLGTLLSSIFTPHNVKLVGEDEEE